MQSPQPVKVGITLSLALTLAIKVAFAPSVAGIETPAEQAASIAGFLERQGFAVGAPLPNVDPPMLQAKRADCSLRIAEVSPLGWHRDVLAQLALPGEQGRFAFRGQLFTSQPVWRTYLDRNWRRVLEYAGLHRPARPVLGILASPACVLQDLPWGQLAEVR